MSDPRALPRKDVFIVFLCIYAAVSLLTLARFAVNSNFGDVWSAATLPMMVEGVAEPPANTRILMPSMIKGLVALTPAAVQEKAAQALSEMKNWVVLRTVIGTDRLDSEVYAMYEPVNTTVYRAWTNEWAFRIWAKHALNETDMLYMRAVMLVLSYIFLLGYAAALYKIGGVLFPRQIAVTLFLPILGMLMPVFTNFPSLWVYDFPTLCLAACCYYCMTVKQWRWYYFWLILACINKESALFVIIFYFLWFWSRMERRTLATHMAAQILIYAAIKLAIYTHYGSASVAPFMGVGFFPYHIVTWLWQYNYSTFVTLAMLAFLLVFNWQEKPAFARCGLLMLPVAYAAFLVRGRPSEYRVFFDIYPLLALLITHTLIVGTGVWRAAIFQPRQGNPDQTAN